MSSTNATQTQQKKNVCTSESKLNDPLLFWSNTSPVIGFDVARRPHDWRAVLLCIIIHLSSANPTHMCVCLYYTRTCSKSMSSAAAASSTQPAQPVPVRRLRRQSSRRRLLNIDKWRRRRRCRFSRARRRCGRAPLRVRRAHSRYFETHTREHCRSAHAVVVTHRTGRDTLRASTHTHTPQHQQQECLMTFHHTLTHMRSSSSHGVCVCVCAQSTRSATALAI